MAIIDKAILIVEDDLNTSRLVETYLQREGFSTLVAFDGEQALRLARLDDPGFVILDIMLPKVDGWEICRQLRQNSDVPILMLTAREEEIDRVLGLTLGADDYVVKPCSPRELARIFHETRHEISYVVLLQLHTASFIAMLLVTLCTLDELLDFSPFGRGC